MQEIKCPHCGKVFQVDESGYAGIVQQVRDNEFHKELERREAELRERRTNPDVRIPPMNKERFAARRSPERIPGLAKMIKRIKPPSRTLRLLELRPKPGCTCSHP